MRNVILFLLMGFLLPTFGNAQMESWSRDMDLLPIPKNHVPKEYSFPLKKDFKIYLDTKGETDRILL